MSLIEGSEIAIITNHGLTDNIKIGRGARPGDVISLTICTIWINSLLEYIKANYEEYNKQKHKHTNISICRT